jgi:hypothetical protein
MNLQPKSQIDAVLPHPHPICALCDTHTLHSRLGTRSSDLTRPTSGHRLPRHELSERTRPPPLATGTHAPIQRP